MKKNEVAVIEQQTNLALLSEMEADAGMGMEGIDKDSVAIPFLSILQPTSPQLETMKEARAGMFINTVTSELFEKALIIPCGFQRIYIGWKPRDEGGGITGIYKPSQIESNPNIIRSEDGHLSLDGNKIQDTRNHFVLVKGENGIWTPAIISLYSTQVKQSRKFISIINSREAKTSEGKSYTPPSFSSIFEISTSRQKNNKGTWYLIDFKYDSPVVDMELYAKARAFSVYVRELDSSKIEMETSVNEEKF
jgi:hypothetical protein